MSNSFALGKRVFAATIAAVTILSTVGLAAFAPLAAHAAVDADPGDNIKGSLLSTVYYYGYDGSRYTYPNEKTYFTWWDNFSNVSTINDGDLADISLAGNVVYRPGSRWVKIDTDPKTYAVARDGMIHWIETEAVATDYAGSNWNQSIDDVPDVFFVDYTAGASLMAADVFDGMLYMDGSDMFVAWDGDARQITSAGKSANFFEDRFFLDGTGIDTGSLTDGSDVTGAVCDLMDAAQTGCTEDLGGNLSVSLASSSAASMDVPNSASGVEVATFKFVAGDAVTLDSLSVSLIGLADTDAIASNGVYLYEDGARLTDGRTVNSSTRKATFAGMNMDFAAGETRELSVVVDMSTTTNDGTFGFAIASDDDVMTNGTVSGSFAINGHTHSIVDLDVGSITISQTGSLTDPTLGEQDAEIAEFNLEAGTAESVWVSRLTLEIEDSADHTDYQLYQGSTWIASGEDIGNDLVLFDIESDPYFLEDGTDRDFQVTADVGGEADDTIKTHLDNDADLLAVGDDFGFGVTVDRDLYDEGASSCASSADDCSFVTVLGGEITLAFNGPAADDVKAGAQDALFFEFSITAERFAEIQEMEFDLVEVEDDGGLDSTYEEAPLTDIRVEDCDSGALIAGPEELTATTDGDTTDTILYTDNFFMDAGETMDLCVTADVEDLTGTIEVGDTHTFTLDVSQFVIEDSSGDPITDIVPGSDLAGNAQTVEQASLITALASSPSGDVTYVKGQSGITTTGFNFTAGTASDVEVTDMTVTVYVDENTGGGFAAGVDGSVTAQDRISSCSLYDASDDSLIDGPESPEADGEMIFNAFSWWVGAGDTETAEVVCNLANVTAGTADEFAFEIDAATDVSALDDEGDTVTPTGTANTAEGTKISVVDAGTLTVVAGADVPDAAFLITGSQDNLVSTFRFDAVSEAFNIDRITVSEEEGEDATGVADDEFYANNVALVSLDYETASGDCTICASGTLTGNERTFNLASGNEIYVPKDDSTDVNVLVDVSVTDRSSGSAQSNEQIRMGLSRDTSADDQVRARGIASNSTLDDDDLAVATATDAQETFVVRETAPTITLSGSTPSGAGFVMGDQEVLRINVAADDNEDLVLRRILFTAALSDNAGSSWNFCDGGTTGEVTASDFDFYKTSALGTALDDDAEWTLYTSDGSVCTADTDIVTFAGLSFSTDAEQLTVTKGTATTYSLFFDSTGLSGVDDDSVQFAVGGDPIVATALSASDLNEADLQGEDTALTVTSSAGYTLGDVLCMDTADNGCGATDELMLLTEITSGTEIQVVRAYLGTAPDTADANDAADDIDRLPGALLWQDDGSQAVSDSDEEYYGAYLVNDLPLIGSNSMSF